MSGDVRYASKADGYQTLANRDRSLRTCRTGREVLAAACRKVARCDQQIQRGRCPIVAREAVVRHEMLGFGDVTFSFSRSVLIVRGERCARIERTVSGPEPQ